MLSDCLQLLCYSDVYINLSTVMTITMYICTFLPQSGIDAFINAGFTGIVFVRVVQPTSQPTDDDGLSDSEIIGIVVGSTIGVLVIISLIILTAFCW